MNPPDDFPTTDTEHWLLAPVFDGLDDTDSGPESDDLLLDDGHLGDLGVSVLADVLAGVADATDGLEPDHVNRAHAHAVACTPCSNRIDSVGHWSAALRGETTDAAATERSVVAAGSISPSPAPAEPAMVGTSVGTSGATDNVVSLKDAKTKRRFPRYLVPVAASLAALAIGGSAMLRSNVTAETTSDVAAAAPNTQAEGAAPDTTVAAFADQEAAAETTVAAAAEAAPETSVAAAALAQAPETPANQTAKPAPAPTAPITDPPAVFNVDGPAEVIPSVPLRPPGGGAKDQAEIGRADNPENKTGDKRSGVLPRLVGSFQTLEQAATRLQAVPSVAVNNIEPPCRTVLQRLLTEKGADPDEARFARADIDAELVTLAIVQDGDSAIVVAADSACKPVQ
jgi:hypothetical protein